MMYSALVILEIFIQIIFILGKHDKKTYVIRSVCLTVERISNEIIIWVHKFNNSFSNEM